MRCVKLNDATNSVFKDFLAACRKKISIGGKVSRIYHTVSRTVYDGNCCNTIGGDEARFQ